MTAVNRERLAIFQSRLFLFGLCLRVFLLFISGEEVFQKYFIPFLDQFAREPLANPWQNFTPEYFPYGLFPLLILGLPKVIAYGIIGELSTGLTVINFILIKVPLLALDTLLFWIFSRITIFNGRRLILFYWLNPVIIYITFIFGQFDIISMSLMTCSLFLLGKKRPALAGLVAGTAVASKFHVAIILPFVAAYIWNNQFRRQAYSVLLQYFIPLLVAAFVGFLPLLLSHHLGYTTLASPEALRLFAAKFSLGLGQEFLLGFSIVVLMLARLVFSTKITYSGLVYGSGFLLGGLVLTTNAAPGWYLWVFPFLSLFFANFVLAPWIIFVGTGLIYLLHFLKVFSFHPLFQSISFTLLQVGLLIQLLILYWMVLRQDCQLRYRLRPLMLGLSGDSGAGKNHLCLSLQALLDPGHCLVIEGDDYHKWERGDQNWEILTHLNPQANNLLAMQEHARRISRGQPICQHHYDHSSGRFVQQDPHHPKKTIIFQGLHSLYLKSLRDILDLRIFLDPNEKVRTFWKVQRDVFKRGYNLEKVLQLIEKRKNDSISHILPQKLKSDWIIEIDTDATIDLHNLKEDSQIPLYVRYTLYNDEPVALVIESLRGIGLDISIEFSSTDFERVIICIRGEPTQGQIEAIANELFPDMRHLTRGNQAPEFLGGIDGLHQLILLSILSKRMETLQ